MIPSIIHFVFGLCEDFGGRPFSLIHYLVVMAAAGVNQPDQIMLHAHYQPTGKWWERAKRLVKVRYIEPCTTTASGVPLDSYAHRADFARLAVLRQYGGIYLDLDVLCVQPFGPLLKYTCVMGRQHDGKLCNGVILAERGAPLLEAWWDQGIMIAPHPTTGALNWDGFACDVPTRLVADNPDLAHVEPTQSFHYPSYDRPGLYFEPSDLDFPGAYCHHLWESQAWERYMRDLTPEEIRKGASPFARMAGPWLPSDLNLKFQ